MERLIKRLRHWFVILADCDVSLAVFHKLKPISERTLYHPSGRPWITGSWDPAAEVVSTSKDRNVAVIGANRIASQVLAQWLVSNASNKSGATLQREFPGSFFTIESFNGEISAEGTISGYHRLYYADYVGTTIAAN